MVTFTLHQATEVIEQPSDGPHYRVHNEVTAATGASPAVFVFKTSTQAFDHYARAADLEQWPDSYEEALLRELAFYRAKILTRTWDTLADLSEDLAMTLQRTQRLANELNLQQGAIAVDRTTVVVGV